MSSSSRRNFLRHVGFSAGLSAAALATPRVWTPTAQAAATKADSLPMQLYKSLSDEQREKICLPANHARRGFVSNWWYIHKDYRINNTFNAEQRELIQSIFDSLHNPEFREKVNRQVEIDQYNDEDNAPAVGFFGTPDDDSFEFLYTGHHVTRRCNAHTDKGQGFGGGPVFYGHFLDEFVETSEHIGNPYWYQGKVFNRFVQTLSPEQQAQGLASVPPRNERGQGVIGKRKANWPGLSCASLDADAKQRLLQTMGEMLAMFRADDVTATVAEMKERNLVDQLYVSWYDGKYDVGQDKVWDTFTIEGPEMVWYFRGQPHIHCYFHLSKAGERSVG